MFKAITDRRKRRAWSPLTITISVGAHLVLLALVVRGATAETRRPEDPDFEWIDVPDKAPPPPPAPIEVQKPDPAPAPVQPDQPPTPGDFVTPRPPEDVPTGLPPVDPNDTPISQADVTGDGHEGDVIGTPPAHPTPPTGTTTANGDGTAPMLPENVSVLPELASRPEAERMLQRAYPALLRDAGITGRTVVMLIIDREGKVEPGSVSVQATTHDAFREAAIRAAEKFRFRPARLNGNAVPVIISLPIEWRLQN